MRCLICSVRAERGITSHCNTCCTQPGVGTPLRSRREAHGRLGRGICKGSHCCTAPALFQMAAAKHALPRSPPPPLCAPGSGPPALVWTLLSLQAPCSLVLADQSARTDQWCGTCAERRSMHNRFSSMPAVRYSVSRDKQIGMQGGRALELPVASCAAGPLWWGAGS
jgi:hypothetical protein